MSSLTRALVTTSTGALKMSGSAGAISRLTSLKTHLAPSAAITHRITTRTMSAANLTTDAAREVLATRRSIPILDSSISFLDTGLGDNIVLFLHGNPTSAFLWRNIIPHVRPYARCLAPDLIGMGHSGKEPNNNYRFVDHYKYLCNWIDTMELPPGRNISLVIHDWGSALGFHWANQHRDRIQSIVHMEGLAGTIESWDTFPDMAGNMFKALRSPAGEEIVLKKNIFVERMLPGAILRKLSDEEMEEYRMPFKEPGESRRPTLTWPREIPIEGHPVDVCRFADDYHDWLCSDDSPPKMYIDAEPGFFSPSLKKIVQKFTKQKVVSARGSHFLQEDSPKEIGEAIANFLINDIY